MRFDELPAYRPAQEFFPLVADFAEKFKLNIVQASYGIQALAQEGLIITPTASSNPQHLIYRPNKTCLSLKIIPCS